MQRRAAAAHAPGLSCGVSGGRSAAPLLVTHQDAHARQVVGRAQHRDVRARQRAVERLRSCTRATRVRTRGVAGRALHALPIVALPQVNAPGSLATEARRTGAHPDGRLSQPSRAPQMPSPAGTCGAPRVSTRALCVGSTHAHHAAQSSNAANAAARRRTYERAQSALRRRPSRGALLSLPPTVLGSSSRCVRPRAAARMPAAHAQRVRMALQPCSGAQRRTRARV